jgi:hypothetical protein
VKYGPEHRPKSAPNLTAARLDGSEIALTSFGGDMASLSKEMQEHLVARIRGGVKLMKSTLGNAAWGEGGDFRSQGVVILLAGNSSRSSFVEKVLAEELGLDAAADAGGAPFKVWRPDSDAPFQQVVLYEMPSRTERGVTIVGVTPKTAVALGALKIANNEVHLMRKAQGFSYFLGDLRGFPPKFTAIVPMGTPPADATQPGPHWVQLGRWDTKTPLRVSKEYAAGKMTSNDPRVFLVPTGLPPGLIGRLSVCGHRPGGGRPPPRARRRRDRSAPRSTSPSSCAEPRPCRRHENPEGTIGMWSPEGRKQKAEDLKALSDKVLRYRQLADRFFGYFQPDSDNGRQLRQIRTKLEDLRGRAPGPRQAPRQGRREDRRRRPGEAGQERLPLRVAPEREAPARARPSAAPGAPPWSSQAPRAVWQATVEYYARTRVPAAHQQLLRRARAGQRRALGDPQRAPSSAPQGHATAPAQGTRWTTDRASRRDTAASTSCRRS